MVLISLHPFVFRKIALLAAAILGLSSVVSFGDSLLMARRYSPAGITGPSELPLVPIGGRDGECGHPEPISVIGIESLDITPIANQVDPYPRLCPAYSESN
jgi:hypothetical protein